MVEFFTQTTLGIFLLILGECLLVVVLILVALAFLMYADRKINQLLAERRSVFNQVSELTNRIKLQARQT